jgi:flagellar hook-associated protein FlgK
MLSSFFGLEMGKRALNAFRQGIETAGHNIANVDTEGYSRQRVNLATTEPYTAPGLSSPAAAGQIGTGVKVDEIVRIRDAFLDFQYRSELSSRGYYDRLNDLYKMVQTYITEPAGSGIRAGFDSLWGALESLQTNPESSAVRTAAVEAANSLGSMVGALTGGYDQYAATINSEVKSLVDQANTMLYEVAALNKEIAQIQALGQNPNDLMDKRDLLLDRLTEIIDIDIQEPYKSGDVTGEFFITLNGRTLVQGGKVRELAAHAFQWGDETYYDVQVKDNEFDIVEDCSVALALATGPEGVHLLRVDRLANGESWTVGGEDALCLNGDGSLKTVLTSKASGELTLATDQTYIFTVTSGKYIAEFTLACDDPINPTKWNMTAKVSSNSGAHYTDAADGGSAGGVLTTEELAAYMKNVFTQSSVPVSATVNSDKSFTLTSDKHSVAVTYDPGVPSGSGTSPTPDFLGFTTNYVEMRVRPSTTTEALGLATAFRIQVGSQGTRVSSAIFDNSYSNVYGLKAGEILGTGEKGESYTFRVGAHDYEANVTVEWVTDHWVIRSDTGKERVLAVGAPLTADDMMNFLREALPAGGNNGFNVAEVTRNSEGKATQFSIASDDNYLISISDVSGGLAAKMGMVNDSPVITIDVAPEDSLETIRNKINEKYQEAYGLTNPEDWVHAELAQDADQSWYLTIASNVAGEAQRITLMGDESGNMQTLRRLGLVKLDPPAGSDSADTAKTYREVTAYVTGKVAVDASFTFDGVRYLSADNKFQEARRVPAGTNRADYSAGTLETVSEGIWLDLKGTGQTAITVRHHVQDGAVKALEDIRDGLIPGLKAEMDEIAWTMVNNLNAYQYAGYGIGDNSNTTGTAFFEELQFKSGSASKMSVSDAVRKDVSLIGAATGELNAEGKAVSGKSAGDGSGANAARMASMYTAKLLNSRTASLGEYYEAYLAKIGSNASQASLMYDAQLSLTEQIDIQRQSVMGVNIEEEMLDILRFNQAFNAMSRYVTTIDEMLDRLINSFGLVGR